MLMGVQLLLDIHWVPQVSVFNQCCVHLALITCLILGLVDTALPQTDSLVCCSHLHVVYILSGDNISIFFILAGARCVSTLLNEMKRQGKDCRFGVISMCIGT